MDTYNGHVRTPQDAIILFEACRLGLLPRVQRRLSEKERQQIKSGSVFVWDEREAGMRRWTDGKSWSASRVSGSFLTYREMEGKRGGSGFGAPPKKANGKAGEGSQYKAGGGDSDAEAGEDGPDGYRYKPDGLMKQSFSITTSSGQHLHLISYYARTHPTAQVLNQPSNDPNLRHIRPQKGMYPESTVNESQNMPPVTRSPMPTSPYASSPQSVAGGSPYARSAAPNPHPYATSQGYGWPTSPPGAPSPHYSPYYPQAVAPHPGVVHGQPPLQYPPQAFPHVPPPHAPGMTAFDRAPPPMSNSSLPPPPPLPPHAQDGHHSHLSAPVPHYVPHLSPRIAQAAEAAHQLAPTSRPHAPEYRSPAVDPRPSTALSHPGFPPVPRPTSATHATGDGSLPTPMSSSASTVSDSIGGSGSAPANFIPSIGALINGNGGGGAEAAGEAKFDHHHHNHRHHQAAAASAANRADSKSPSSRAQLSTQEVSKEKLGFTEDMRALRQLDKGFPVK